MEAKEATVLDMAIAVMETQEAISNEGIIIKVVVMVEMTTIKLDHKVTVLSPKATDNLNKILVLIPVLRDAVISLAPFLLAIWATWTIEALSSSSIQWV